VLSRLILRHSPARVVPALFALSSAALLAVWAVNFAAPRVAALALYLHTALFGPAVISAFWSLINEKFDPHSGKRAVSLNHRRRDARGSAGRNHCVARGGGHRRTDDASPPSGD